MFACVCPEPCHSFRILHQLVAETHVLLVGVIDTMLRQATYVLHAVGSPPIM